MYTGATVTDCADSVIAASPSPCPTYQIPQRSPNPQFLLLGLTVDFPSIYSLRYIRPQLLLNFLTLDSFHPAAVSNPHCLIKENAGMRGLTLGGDVRRGRWDASAKGWPGMCGISGDKPGPPSTTVYCPILSNIVGRCTAPPFTC